MSELPPPQIGGAILKRVVAENYGLTVRQMLGESRKPRVVRARMIAMFFHHIAWQNSTLNNIGRSFRRPDGGTSRDHTTVLNAINRVRCWIENDSDQTQALMDLGAKVRAALVVEKQKMDGWARNGTLSQSAPSRTAWSGNTPCIPTPTPTTGV